MKTTLELANIKNVADAQSWFEVEHTSRATQTAVMKLSPGQASGEKQAHDQSEQVLLVLEGEVFAEIGDQQQTMRKGDFVLIPAGIQHRFSNRSSGDAVTFNTYSPPEYPSGTSE